MPEETSGAKPNRPNPDRAERPGDHPGPKASGLPRATIPAAPGRRAPLPVRAAQRRAATNPHNNAAPSAGQDAARPQLPNSNAPAPNASGLPRAARPSDPAGPRNKPTRPQQAPTPGVAQPATPYQPANPAQRATPYQPANPAQRATPYQPANPSQQTGAPAKRQPEAAPAKPAAHSAASSPPPRSGLPTKPAKTPAAPAQSNGKSADPAHAAESEVAFELDDDMEFEVDSTSPPAPAKKPRRGLFGRKKAIAEGPDADAADASEDASPADHPDNEAEPAITVSTSDDAETDPNELGEPGEGHTPRMGLRIGRHSVSTVLTRLKARFGKANPDDEQAAIQTEEEEEALAERIEPDDRYKEIETYPIHPPYAHVRILYDDEMKEYIYQVLEPMLTRTEKEILEFIESTMIDTLAVSPEELEDLDEIEFITDRFNDVIFDYSIILDEDEAAEVEIKKKLLYYIRRNFIGHGPIDVVMQDPYIEDISCDGPHVPIFLYHRKYESMRSTVRFGDHDTLDSYVIKMAQRSGKHISIAEPILDATMTDGSRLQSTLAKEVSAAGSTFTIRKFRPDPFTPPDLVMFRTMSAEMLAYLWIAVQNGASIMYAGGTASGKTTSLNAILLFIPPNMKIVSIEDTREVNLPHENWIAGITRHGFGPRDQFGRQAGEIDMFQLLKNALRQRPEYIIVGEVRGQEAYSLFQAMATGHAAYGTMHADSVDAVIHRLESDPINIPRSLLEALDIVSVQVQTRVDGKRVRRTKQISEIVGLDPHTREILTNEVFSWQPGDDSFKFSGVSYTLEKIQIEKGLPAGSMIKELKRRAKIITWMIDRQIQNYKEVSKVVTAYYKEPEILAKLVAGELSAEEIPTGLQEIASRSDEADAATLHPMSAAALASAPGADIANKLAAKAAAKGAQAADEAPETPQSSAKPDEKVQAWPGAAAFVDAVKDQPTAPLVPDAPGASTSAQPPAPKSDETEGPSPQPLRPSGDADAQAEKAESWLARKEATARREREEAEEKEEQARTLPAAPSKAARSKRAGEPEESAAGGTTDQ